MSLLKRLKYIWSIKSTVDDLKFQVLDVAECRRCRCLVHKIDENKGKSTVEKRRISCALYYPPRYKEVLQTNYYCKKCMPKKGKVKK